VQDKIAKHILIVEDSADLQALFRQLFKSEGYALTSAFNGREALAVLATMPVLPHLILLDIMMPIMDGTEFRRVQLENPRYRAIPVVVMTADANFKDKHALLKPAEIISKPIRDIDQLLGLVARLTA
jgi:CheY-like chemotaxis protein